jgi:5-methyltetrahydrofolate--homocysteine methyltransferase
MEILRELVKNGKANETAERVAKLLEEGKDPESIMKDALIPAMDEVGDLFQKGDYFLPEMLVAARAMQRGLDVLQPRLVERGVQPVGRVVIGTVKGDLHDIGKNIVTMALQGAGFEVVDLGIDAPPDKFIEAIKRHNPQVVGLSALLTTTMPAMKNTIEAIKRAGLRNQIKIMVGGASVTQTFADEIGADFYGCDSTEGRNFARNAAAGRV